MSTDAKLLADLNGARISALAGREAARHWCPNLEGDFDSILKGIDAAIERCQLYVNGGLCPENKQPCTLGCSGGWCRTLYGQPE